MSATDTPRDAVAVRARVTSGVLGEVAAERGRQDATWGEQNHPDGTGPSRTLLGTRAKVLADLVRESVDRAAREGTLTYADILFEEFTEAIAEEDPVLLRSGLVQVAAVAAAWVEKIDRDSLTDDQARA